MGRKEENIKKAQALLHLKERIRNIGTAAHIDHGKTTLSDSLIAGAGMISEELAGSQLFMDYDEQEQARGITINAAIASMVHDFEGGQYLINLIDTPGHVDFGGDVTRAMRAIDGVIILVDAVEGIMPQTETVIRQALKERVRPALFINKVDRLVNELKISPDQMQQRFTKIITEVNNRIRKWLPEDMGEKWMVHVEAGSVAFGSAFHKWALSVPFMKKSGITFKDVYKHCQEGTMKELAKKAPLHSVVLNMVIRHLPNPLEAQKVRIPIIWKGDLESPVGKAMMTVDENGPVGYMVTKIIVDPQAGEVAAGRLFSGKIRRGQDLWVIGMPKPQRAQTVAMIVGPDRIPVDEIDAGNVVAVVGLKDAIAGSTVSDDKASDRRVPGGRRREGRSLRREVSEQAQPLLHGGRAARREGGPGDPRGRDRVRAADQGLEGPREEARGTRHGPERVEERRLDPGHEHADRRDEGHPVPARDDGADQGGLHRGDEPRAPRRGEGDGTQGPPRRREAPRGLRPPRVRPGDPRRPVVHLWCHGPRGPHPARADPEGLHQRPAGLHG